MTLVLVGSRDSSDLILARLELLFFLKKKKKKNPYSYSHDVFAVAVPFPSENFKVGHNFFVSEWIVFKLGHNNLLVKTFKKTRQLNLTLTHKLPCPSRSNHRIWLQLAVTLLLICGYYSYLHKTFLKRTY